MCLCTCPFIHACFAEERAMEKACVEIHAMRRDTNWKAYLLPPFIAAKFTKDSALFISNLTEDRASITNEDRAEADKAASRPE